MARARTELMKLEKKRDVWQEAIDAIREIKAGGGRRVHVRVTPAAKARQRTGLSQFQFAKIMGISVRTLQDWEQGRRKPTGAAASLIKIAGRHPEVLRETISP